MKTAEMWLRESTMLFTVLCFAFCVYTITLKIMLCLFWQIRKQIRKCKGVNTIFHRGLIWLFPVTSQTSSTGFANDLLNEQTRLLTFQSYPSFQRASFIRLAGSGFYYSGTGTTIKCIFCGAIHHNLQGYDLFSDMSRLHDHNCTLESRSIAGNVSIHSQSTLGPYSWTNQREPTPDLPHSSHHDCHTNQQETETLRKFGILIQKPKFPDYAIPESRRLTLRNSPEHINARAKEFAEAEFFYTGRRDVVRCFHCGKAFQNWSHDDDPWLEHARLSPDCIYMLLNPERTRNFHRIHHSHEQMLPQQRQALPSGQTQPNRQSERASQSQDHRYLCENCHVQPSTVLLRPCGHLVVCHDCALSITECPVCMHGVQKKTGVLFN